MSHFLVAMGRDIQHSMCQSWRRILRAAAAPLSPYENASSTDTRCSNKVQQPLPAGVHQQLTTAVWSGKKHTQILLAVFCELVYLGWGFCVFLFSCWKALCNLVVMPIVPLLASLCFFKDADWTTWIAKDDSTFWKGKVAWITGASGGIGAELARSLAKRGVALILSGRNATSLEMVKSSIVSMGYLSQADVLVLPLELAHLDSIPAAVQKAIQFKGKVNILFNNAGMLAIEPVDESTWSTTEDVMKVNLLAPIRLCHEIIPHMQALSGTIPVRPIIELPTIPKDNTCHIVFTNSMEGLISLPYHAAYSTSKHGLLAYARTLAGELEGKRSNTSSAMDLSSDATAMAPSESANASAGKPCANDNFFASVARALKNHGTCSANTPANEQIGEICVTTVIGGTVQTELTAKRIDSKHPRIVGLQSGQFPGKAGPLKPLLPDVKAGMSPERFTELMLISVSNKLRESWVAKVSDLVWMHLAHYTPDLMAKVTALTAGGFYSKYARQGKDMGSAASAFTTSTTANTSRNHLSESASVAK